MRELTPTHSALLELKEERQGVREGYRFLDEKRIVLAAEMLRELETYRQRRAAYDQAQRQARQALLAAVQRHGLQGLQVYTKGSLDNAVLRTLPRSVLGVGLMDASLEVASTAPPPAVYKTPEAEDCRAACGELVRKATQLGSSAANLQRLQQEYRRTARRARAIEDVLLPELEQTIDYMDLTLEDLEREEAVRGLLNFKF